MSNKKLKTIKIKINYDDNVPRCGICLNYVKPKTVLVNSVPRFVFSKCKAQALLKPSELGICDNWIDKKTKETLEQI